jgi:carbonic anhydrase/acetyltransferase-like protein (isoleucine patch superfamily)
VGRRLTIQDDAVLFRSEVGNNVTIGERALVIGVTLPDGTYVSPDDVITNQGQADALTD